MKDSEHDHLEDAGEEGNGPSSMDWVQDSHLQELLLNQASNNARVAAREKVKLNQLEIDAVTPLYEGCGYPSESSTHGSRDESKTQND